MADENAITGLWDRTGTAGRCINCHERPSFIGRVFYRENELRLCCNCIDALWALLDSMLEEVPE
jgi:hypothetical protein